MSKVNDKIAAFQEENPGKPFYSFEYFPPKTASGETNLYDRFDRMASLNPMWIDVTWGAGGSTSEKTMTICTNALQYHGLDVMMHLTCTNITVESVHEALVKCKEVGICNILALRGDPPAGQENWTATIGGFSHASDLVKYIRKHFGDYFCIAVAGYPENHLESPDQAEDMKWMKEKVDAGADLIVTQLFYDCDEFLGFVKRCRDMDITIPILPGIMPIQSYNGFKRMTGFCKTKVPDEITEALEPIKEDEAKVKAYGVELGVKMCKKLLENGVPGLHFYTLNLETSVMKIIDGLGVAQAAGKTMPWRRAVTKDRQGETVRPIFWANRSKSYIQRTAAWDDFPNGRFGNRASPAYGEFNFVSMCHESDAKLREERRKMWGESPQSAQDIGELFVGYVKGDVKKLPWCQDAIIDETNFIKKQLLQLNKGGMWTINSQPRVNGALSTDPYFGWGPDGGFVYQKAYVEFFCNEEVLTKFLEMVDSERWNSLGYTAVKTTGETRTNLPANSVTAVTWGVFPDREVVQPTVVDSSSFMAWKDEAFALWTEFIEIYEEGSQSQKVVKEISESCWLVNVYDNDYVASDLFTKLVACL
mmetsp:Transcript_43923/g.108175  ORF Transcript_43923/g.108175 Transcript_43923/m.108175 type:complete len:590 (+) Transcript_43923:56-1825(+)